tara:strand:- start:3878 stop:4963 length:1086 start_codon:yes stop_codon:yes gene_type:complete
MSYLDQKEEVISLELTPYGKYLLSIGELDPVYYAFFDDDIIYDSEYANIDAEPQNNVEPRIQEETPRFAAQGVQTSRETDIISKRFVEGGIDLFDPLDPTTSWLLSEGRTNEVILYNLLTPQPLSDENTLKWQPIGKSDPSKQNAPAWNVSFLKAELSSSSDTLLISGSHGTSHYNVPQLNSEVEYIIERNSKKHNVLYAPDNLVEEPDPTTNPELLDSLSILPYSSGATITVKKDFLVIRVEESNVNFDKENFEIELFEVQTYPVTGEEILSPIKFYKNEEDALQDSINNRSRPDVANWYFDILVDQEIGSDVICPLITEDKTKQFYNTNMFGCEDIDLFRGDVVQNIYFEEDDTKDVCE